ncbi:hypothetical protein BSL78_24853 [Apostichopus japonicus]|uniref:Endonuclease/exonuclease/phosphatase domain-containing protein n=1 Tax=Stichopus japonicus TaxID=307972 RepID=A0A2G8JRI5_STIJA|nr:hypothetical protein BSL78_24853 [Apostichopus japonicus]
MLAAGHRLLGLAEELARFFWSTVSPTCLHADELARSGQRLRTLDQYGYCDVEHTGDDPHYFSPDTVPRLLLLMTTNPRTITYASPPTGTPRVEERLNATWDEAVSAMTPCHDDAHHPKSVTNGDVPMVQDQPSLLQLFSIGCWNIRTLQTPLAAEHLELSLSNYRYDIIGLSETHNIGKQEDLGGRLIMSGGQIKRAGVGILMSPRAYRAMCNCWQLSDRLMAARYRLMQGSLLFISVYAPTANSTNDVREAFYGELDDFIHLHRKRTDILAVAGDWNAKIGSSENGASIIGPYGHGTRNEAGARLIDFAASNV